jgi:hypothetical protein
MDASPPVVQAVSKNLVLLQSVDVDNLNIGLDENQREHNWPLSYVLTQFVKSSRFLGVPCCCRQPRSVAKLTIASILATKVGEVLVRV